MPSTPGEVSRVVLATLMTASAMLEASYSTKEGIGVEATIRSEVIAPTDPSSETTAALTLELPTSITRMLTA
jgi:hypothetical protein